MIKKVKIFLADGFEENEALIPFDILTRGGVECELISITGYNTVSSSHGVRVVAALLKDLTSAYDLLLLPGGMPGTLNLDKCDRLKEELLRANKEHKLLAAICAAPMVLGGLGLLKDKFATCYPGFEDKLIGAKIRNAQVEHDGNIITAIGAGASFEFALEILATLTSPENAQKVKEQIILK